VLVKSTSANRGLSCNQYTELHRLTILANLSTSRLSPAATTGRPRRFTRPTHHQTTVRMMTASTPQSALPILPCPASWLQEAGKHTFRPASSDPPARSQQRNKAPRALIVPVVTDYCTYKNPGKKTLAKKVHNYWPRARCRRMTRELDACRNARWWLGT
jgi:hypothetical protein